MYTENKIAEVHKDLCPPCKSYNFYYSSFKCSGFSLKDITKLQGLRQCNRSHSQTVPCGREEALPCMHREVFVYEKDTAAVCVRESTQRLSTNRYER